MKKFLTVSVGLMAVAGFAAASPTATPDTIYVPLFDARPALVLPAPLMIDSVDVNGASYDPAAVMAYNRHSAPGQVTAVARGEALKTDSAATMMGRLSFRLDVKSFVKGLTVKAPDGAKVFVGGQEVRDAFNLKPGSHIIDIDWMGREGSNPTADVALIIPAGSKDKVRVTTTSATPRRMPSLNDFSDGTHTTWTSISPDGRYLMTYYLTVAPGGLKRDSYTRITNLTTGAPAGGIRRDNARWMPTSPLLYATRIADDGTNTLFTIDPATGVETILANALPEGYLTISPTEDFAILTTYVDGPAEGDVYQILEPEDRQPGWRRRARLWKVDFKSGVTTPLTFGFRQLYLNDIASDGSKILVTTQRSRYEKRPTTLRDLLSIDLATLKADTIVKDDGFVNSAIFSPDGSKVLISGTPEALDGIGLNLPEGRTASMIEGELFIVDPATGTVDPITKYFDPSVTNAAWSRADGKIYLTAENGDLITLYAYDPAGKGGFRQVVDREELVSNFSLPVTGSLMAWRGQSASNSDRLYVTDLRRGSTRLIDSPSDERLAAVELGDCIPFDYVTSRGDTINARYYLPADFNPSKKYPVIVNYYGGCSPTSRNFESRYPHHLYAAQGYAVLVINPGGCTGRGQEWASRHVNTAGEGVAQDIIEGTQQFCRLNEWADSTALGCIGASYGGFMTQYLQTQTPMFAAAISHAGISDHTSYWGEGYWGYSYSETSMANSYPWDRQDLYVGHSPLYLADKITTPLLFLHADSDTNVPPGESIQMFTALKILGRPTAFVAVADQDHHILDYDKRIKWQDTIFAWFEKYLKHDSTWWDALYPPKSL